jgi:ABC-type bacteriocin/lantibiotic exporter with double-glycine peptidase domain
MSSRCFRLNRPQRGEVLLGGVSVHRNRAEATSMIGFVMREDSLFSGTIGEKIHFFDDAPIPDNPIADFTTIGGFTRFQRHCRRTLGLC